MNNAELIKSLRCEVDCGDCNYFISKPLYRCDAWGMRCDAADALEADEKRIAVVEEERDLERFAAKNYLDKIDELKAQIPKEGEWIIIGISVNGSSTAKCSKCGAIVHDSFTNTPNYCPNCGARMKTVTDCHALESER